MSGRLAAVKTEESVGVKSFGGRGGVLLDNLFVFLHQIFAFGCFLIVMVFRGMRAGLDGRSCLEA